MKKLYEWFLLNFLPAWAKETVYKENQRLKKQIEEQQHTIKLLEAYIDGMEYVVNRRPVIRNEVNQK